MMDGEVERYAQAAEESARLLGLTQSQVETIGYYQRGNHQATDEEFKTLMRNAGTHKLSIHNNHTKELPMRHITAVLGILFTLLTAPLAWADPAQLTTPCTINHDNWPPFSATQWEYRACSVAIPSLAPYSAVEVTFAPITQIAPVGHPGWSAECRYATPTWINAPEGTAVTTTTDGTVVRVMAINLRQANSAAGTLTVGISCQ